MAALTLAEIDTAIRDLVVGGVQSVELSDGTKYTKLSLPQLESMRTLILGRTESDDDLFVQGSAFA